MLTRQSDLHPFTSHFYIVKLGFIGVIFFLIVTVTHRLWVLARAAEANKNYEKEKSAKNHHFYSLQKSIFITSHFYIVKLGFIGVIFFLIVTVTHRLWVLARAAEANKNYEKEKSAKNHHFYSLQKSIFIT